MNENRSVEQDPVIHGMMPDPSETVQEKSALGDEAAKSHNLLALMMPSYLLGGALLLGLVLAAGFWEVIADSRVLAGLLDLGVIALGEEDPGVASIPGVEFFIRSQELIGWPILVLASSLFIVVAMLKGIQFHRIAGFVGIEGTFAQHVRAFIYGNGLGRMLPFKFGTCAWAAALEGQGGADRSKAAQLAKIFSGFQLFEIATFAFIGLLMSNLLSWAIGLAPALLILLASWLMMRPKKSERLAKGSTLKFASRAISELGRTPQMFVGLILLSLLSFALVEFASYIVPQAFNSPPVVPLFRDELGFLIIRPNVIVMAVVAGYVARLIPMTPGGIGQFELAFAMVLITNGLPLSQSVVVALLVSAVRYSAGAILFAVTMLAFGVETNFQRVKALFFLPAQPTEEIV